MSIRTILIRSKFRSVSGLEPFSHFFAFSSLSFWIPWLISSFFLGIRSLDAEQGKGVVVKKYVALVATCHYVEGNSKLLLSFLHRILSVWPLCKTYIVSVFRPLGFESIIVYNLYIICYLYRWSMINSILNYNSIADLLNSS